MTLNLVSNSGLVGNKGSKAISSIGAGGLQFAEFDEGASTGATFSTASWGDRNYRIGKCTSSGQSIVLATSGYVENILILGGGGGGGGTDADGSSYPGGGGGSGGIYWKQMIEAEKGTYTADQIGAGGLGGGNRTSGTSGGQTKVTLPTIGQVTCGGGSSGDGLYQSPSGYSSGANGGGRGGAGGQQSAPGQANGPGESMMPLEYRLFSQLYGQGRYGGTNTGNGGTSGKSNGASGVFLMVIPILTV